MRVLSTVKNKSNRLFGGIGRHRGLRSQICAERDRLYRIAWSWCHDSHQADDLAQETLARALARIDGLREEGRLQIWLTQVVNLPCLPQPTRPSVRFPPNSLRP